MIICLFLFSAANAQVNLEEIIKPGTQLHYLYYPSGDSNAYNLSITIKNLYPVPVFEWQLDLIPSKKGVITHSAAEMKTGSSFYYFFREKAPLSKPGSLTLWLSQQLFMKLTNDNSAPVNVGLYGKNKPPVAMKTFKDAVEFSYLLDGKVIAIKEKLVKRVEQNGKEKAGSDSGFFTFNNSAKLPLIMRLHAGFYLELQEITTK